MKVREIDKKQISAIKGHTTRLQAQVDSLEVNDDESMELAGDLRSKIKQYERAMAKEKKEWLDPINVLRTKVFGVFRPFEAQVDEAIKKVDSKIIAYQIYKEEEARKIEAKLQARIEKGTLKPETALRKMGEVDVPDSMITSEHGKTIVREHRDIEVVDIGKIPREWLVPDYVAIRQAVLTENKIVPGVKIVTRKVLASR